MLDVGVKMGKFARRADKNQPEIVSALRKAGARVDMMYRIPKMLDIIVSFRGALYWAELKMPGEKLTDDERELIDAHAHNGVTLYVWHTADEALKAIGAI